jgi:hypothetical protein
MCIYCDTDNYKKIYEHHHGPIPKEEDGRSYEIHHVDGNHSNNDPMNLMAVTLQEHYTIHESQGDWYACWLMSWQRMNKTPEEISALASAVANEQVKNGTHPWQTRLDGTSLILERMSDPDYVNPLSKRTDGTSVSSDNVTNGTHNFLKRSDGSSIALDRVLDGTHHLLSGEIQRKSNAKRIENGTHHMLTRSDGTSYQQDLVKNGEHHFLRRSDGSTFASDLIAEGRHNTQIMKTCEHCGKTMNSFIFGRYHGDRCKKAPPK